MRLDLRTGKRWHQVLTFSIEDAETARRVGLQLLVLQLRAGEPAEARIVDAMEVPVLQAILPLGWAVPKGLEDYEWVP